MDATSGRLIVIGYGNMGKALVQGVTTPPQHEGDGPDAQPLYTLDRVIAVDTHHSAGGPDVRRVASIGLVGLLSEHDEVVLAVKPQVYPEIAPALAAALPEVSLMVLSVMAGITTRRLALDLGMRGRAVRAMPNTPAQVGEGATAYAPGPYATDADAERAEVLLKRLGPLVLRLDESRIDAFTAVAGSGPAYLFLLAEAMAEGAVAAGFDAATAGVIVRQTLFGSATLLARDHAPIPDLRARVTSKGGTTEAAITLLDDRRVRDAVVAAVLAARDRGRELGRQY